MTLTTLTPLSLLKRTDNPPAFPLLYPPPPTALKSFNDPNDPNDPNDLKVLKAPNVLFPLKKQSAQTGEVCADKTESPPKILLGLDFLLKVVTLYF